MNLKKTLLSSLSLLCCFLCGYSQPSDAMPFVLDMVHNNPGEAPFITKYHDGNYLKSQGFNGTVTRWLINCAITYDNFEKNIVPKNSDERHWIENHAAKLDKMLTDFEKAGIDVYPFTDFIVFPKSIWQKYPVELRGSRTKEDGYKPDIQQKLVQDLVRAQVAAIFNRFPMIDGLTLRFGETYLHDAPFHHGGSPIRSKELGIKDHVTLINILREEICVKRNKKLFYRTWDFGYNFHTNPQYYLSVTNQIEPHHNLLFSVKYQQDDYLRMTPFNPTLGIGKHSQIIEAQSRMEAYGKGAHPYYSAKGVIDGWPETKYVVEYGTHKFTGELNNPSNPRGIKDVLTTGLIKGVMTWSHGGGWAGPYISHEIWTDLNTYVVSHWAQCPSKSESELFAEFSTQCGFTGLDADRFRQIALLSIEAVRKGQCNSYTFNEMWWARDDYFVADKNRGVVKDIVDRHLTDKVLSEKAEASAMWLQIENIAKQLENKDDDLLEAIQVSCTYGRIKYQLIEQMWILMLEQERANAGKTTLNTTLIESSLARYDQLWIEWKELKEASKYCATLYTDTIYRGSMGEFINKLRNLK